MNCVDLRRMRRVGEELTRQVTALGLLREELCQAEEKIKYMAYVDETRQIFAQSREAMDENIRVLTTMAAVLREAAVQYHRTEEKIADRYNLDTVVYPDTQFGVSRITGMEAYKPLMPF